MDEPLGNVEATQLIREIVASGSVTHSKHALQRMNERQVEIADVTNVLRGGHVTGSEIESGTWRYKVRTQRFEVVVAFRSQSEVRVISAWRIEQ